MAIDPSIILGGQTKPVDPLALAGQALTLKNALIQNQGNQQQLDARNALGRIYAGAIDPTTHQLVPNKLTQGFGDPQNAAAGYLAPEVFQQEQARQKGQIENEAAQVDLAHKQIGYFQDTLGSLIAKKDLSPNDVYGAAADAIADHMMTVDQAHQELSSMPQPDPARQSDSRYLAQYQNELRNWVVDHRIRLNDLTNQLKAHYGEPYQVNAGNATIMGYNNPISGTSTAIGAVETGLSPGESVTPAYQRYNNATHQMETITKGQAAAAQSGGSPAEGIPASAPIGETEALTDSSNESQRALKASSDYRMNVRPLLQEIESELDSGIWTGPAAHGRKLLGQYAAQLGINTDNTPRMEVADKVLEMLAQRNLSQLSGPGVPTDAKLSSAQNASPSTKLSNAGLRETLATVQGTGQAVDLLGQAYAAHKRAFGTKALPFNDFKVQFARQVDPYVLVLRSMPPDAMRQALDAMKPDERARITASSDTLDKLAAAIGWEP